MKQLKQSLRPYVSAWQTFACASLLASCSSPNKAEQELAVQCPKGTEANSGQQSLSGSTSTSGSEASTSAVNTSSGSDQSTTKKNGFSASYTSENGNTITLGKGLFLGNLATQDQAAVTNTPAPKTGETGVKWCELETDSAAIRACKACDTDDQGKALAAETVETCKANVKKKFEFERAGKKSADFVKETQAKYEEQQKKNEAEREQLSAKTQDNCRLTDDDENTADKKRITDASQIEGETGASAKVKELAQDPNKIPEEDPLKTSTTEANQQNQGTKPQSGVVFQNQQTEQNQQPGTTNKNADTTSDNCVFDKWAYLCDEKGNFK